ncbi:RNA methyltransferase [Bacteroidetes bacterium UKL13-3]|jgi:tRNA G18 (ribose-2'-O)-methylase SpoU|nr:RNA methyltransferase [Bacteroidetes bacterium UKL13-3]HCP92459.1 RNA methyltransferase [Bacteroidota bacterium]
MDHAKLKLDELNRLSVEEFKNTPKADIIFVLDNIRSAQNIGSIFRTSDAFNISAICITGISATPPNKEMLKTALGSTESVDWKYYPEALQCVRELKASGYTIISVEQTANSTKLHEFTPQKKGKYALVMGNEVEGVDQQIINESDIILEIPQFGTKHSLNVAVSAGMVLWDVYQKMFLGR